MPINLDEIRADLEYASSGIDGPDTSYHPHALAAMRAAEKLLAEVERQARVIAAVESITRDTDGNDLGPDEEIPVGEVCRMLYDHPEA